jgi:hypothetical protein
MFCFLWVAHTTRIVTVAYGFFGVCSCLAVWQAIQKIVAGENLSVDFGRWKS